MFAAVVLRTLSEPIGTAARVPKPTGICRFDSRVVCAFFLQLDLKSLHSASSRLAFGIV
jgi:hypothetical protein